jgi:hypothetical protein
VQRNRLERATYNLPYALSRPAPNVLRSIERALHAQSPSVVVDKNDCDLVSKWKMLLTGLKAACVASSNANPSSVRVENQQNELNALRMAAINGTRVRLSAVRVMTRYGTRLIIRPETLMRWHRTGPVASRRRDIVSHGMQAVALQSS